MTDKQRAEDIKRARRDMTTAQARALMRRARELMDTITPEDETGDRTG